MSSNTAITPVNGVNHGHQEVQIIYFANFVLSFNFYSFS